MHYVDVLFGGEGYKTTVLVSESAATVVEQFARSRDGQRFVKKVREYAISGFRNWTSASGPIRYEWDGVFRIGHSAMLFRMLGFYEKGKQDTFVVIDAFHKHGQKLRANERARIDAVASVMQRNDWRIRIQ